MAIYKLSEILNCLKSMSDDGYEYVVVTELETVGEYTAVLSIDAIISEDATENEQIDSVNLPHGYFHLP